MRITPEILRKIAGDTVAQRTRSNRDLLAVYMIGSLLSDDPLIGGTTDIDLVFIYNGEKTPEREIIRLTEEIHLDIAHHSRFLYHQTRELRLHPWMGPNIYHCRILYDPQHFMDFTQASVRGQFDHPENVLARVHAQSEAARQTWLSYQLETPTPGPEEIDAYLKAVADAANAVASLSGSPLAERRLLLEFQKRAENTGHAGLFKGLLGLLGAHHVDKDLIRSWLPDWRAALDSISPDQAPSSLHRFRQPYYQKAIEAALSSKEPHTALWLLLKTWTKAVCLLPNGDNIQTWLEAMQQLHLTGESFQDRLSALDAFLDTIDETIDEWSASHGIMQ
jgi:hypothetical protein